MSQEATKSFWEALLDICSPEGYDNHISKIFDGNENVPINELITLFAFIMRRGTIPEEEKPKVVKRLLLESIADAEGAFSYLPEVALTIRELGGYKTVVDRFSASEPFSGEWQVCWKILGEMLSKDDLVWADLSIKNFRETEEETTD